MTILETSNELSGAEKYFLSKSPEIRRMKEISNEEVQPDIWMIYSDTKSDGTEQEIFSMRTTDGEVYATNSKTFISDFRDILECFNKEDIHTIKVVEGTSRAGRKFLECAYIN